MNRDPVDAPYGWRERVADWLTRDRYSALALLAGEMRDGFTACKTSHTRLTDRHTKTRDELEAAHRDLRNLRRERDTLLKDHQAQRELTESARHTSEMLTASYAELLSNTHHLTLQTVLSDIDMRLPYANSTDGRMEEENLAFMEADVREALADSVRESAMTSAHYDPVEHLYVGTATLTVSMFMNKLREGGVELIEGGKDAPNRTDPLAEAHGGEIEVLPPPVSLEEED